MIKRYKILLISKFTSSEINQAKVAFASYFLLNYKDSYELHILTSEPEENYAEFVKRIKPFCKIRFFNTDTLEHISESCKEFKSIILFNQNTLTIEQIDENFRVFQQYQMVGYLRYQTEFDLIKEGYQIPFVDGVFSNGWLMLNNIQFDMEYVKKFIETFKISRDRSDFNEIFLSWLCISKLKTPDISVESAYCHSKKLDNLKLVYYSDNPYNVYPWVKNNKTVYIMYYIKQYLKISELFKCEFCDIVKKQYIPSLKDFETDLKEMYNFRGWNKVFIPICERDIRIKAFDYIPKPENIEESPKTY